MMLREPLRTALSALVILVAATMYLLPALLGAPHLVPGFFEDTLVSLWSLNWCAQFLRGVTTSLYAASALFAPEGASLLLHNLSESLLLPASLLTFGLSVPLAYTILCIGLPTLNGIAALMLARTLGASQRLSLGVALIFAVHPWILCQLAGGHLNLVGVAPVLFLCGALLKKTPSSRQSSWILVSLCTALLAYTDYYQLWFGMMLALVILCIERAWRRVGPLVLGLCIGAPKLWFAASLARSGTYTPNHDPATNGMDLVSLVAPGPTQMLASWGYLSDLRSRVVLNFSESGFYLGITFSLMMLLILTKALQLRSWSRELSYLSAALVFTVLALGPILTIAGQHYGIIPGSHQFFQFPLVPPVPARFALPALICFFIAGVLALQRLPRAWACVLVVIAGIEFWPAPVHVFQLPEQATLQVLREMDTVHLVADLASPERSTYHQMIHHKPITAGFLARRPRRAEKRFYNAPYRRYLVAGSVDIDRARKSIETRQIDAMLIPSADQSMLARARILMGQGPLTIDQESALFVLRSAEVPSALQERGADKISALRVSSPD